jgi:ribonuclease VapC
VNEFGIVANASAVIALLTGEPFILFNPQHLANASISAVNFSEVLARLLEIGIPEGEVEIAVANLDLRVVAFDEMHARDTARLRSLTRHAGLSLGVRACLALGNRLGCPVVTGDRAWASLDIGVEVVLIR